MRRLPATAGERIDRSSPVSFTFDGEERSGLEGDTIASALLSGGQSVLSRSFKYHRPRGELCACGRCASSLMTVDGAPGVRACATPLAEGMEVTHQNAWPSLDFDAMAVADWLSALTPVGFYYKTFIRPRRLWPLYERALRRAAGLGRLRRRQSEREWRTEYRRRHCDALVVGGGIAGLSTALRAAELGADVVLCDDDAEPGGELLHKGERERAVELAGRCAEAGVEILTRASVLGEFDGLYPVWQGSLLHQVRAGTSVVATGDLEQPLVFAGNDRPGVMLASGAERLAALYGVGPEGPAVVASTEDRGLESALALHELGIEIAAVADLRDRADGEAVAAIEAAGIELIRGATVVAASGRQRVKGAVLTRVDREGRAQGRARKIECGLIAVSGGAAPASSLLMQAGARARWDAERCRFLPDELPPNVLAAGAVVGHEDRDSAELSGEVAGIGAALNAGFGSEPQRRELAEASRALEDRWARGAGPRVEPPPLAAREGRGRGKAFVDLDEDVTAKDIAHATAEGYDSIELSKRYTTVTMGPSQGRFSQLPSVRALSAASDLSVADVGLTTARPPWTSVPLGVLAGRPTEPAKRSSMHARQRELGATVQWAGDWRRAYDYGDPEGEALAVGESAGVIDVSTLGKLVVRGPDAGEFLDRLYPNRMSTLKTGRVRYGILTSEAGRITDDGTVCRLDEETFYVTTTSSGAAAVEQWFTWWLAEWAELDVTVTDVTQALGAVNLAGPMSRQMLGELTDADLSNEAFPYLQGLSISIAGIDCLAMRIGFVGELGYEIHCAAPHGRSLWDAMTTLGARPFGLEPQRILRLQKMHILVGQDTDSESTPYSSAAGWAVKLDKEQDFIGRWALEQAGERGAQVALAGFTCDPGLVPVEGAAVIDGEGGVVGQVTSARRSPRLGCGIGMAMVPPGAAEEGAEIRIADGDRRISATVTTTPFFDPDGEVLRS